MMPQRNLPGRHAAQQHHRRSPSSSSSEHEGSNDDDNDAPSSNGLDDETQNSEFDTEAEDTRAMFMKARMMNSAVAAAASSSPPPAAFAALARNSHMSSVKAPKGQGSFQGKRAVTHNLSTSAASIPKTTEAADSANDMVYKALMEHKRQEMHRMSTLASDTRTITEAMLRKQVWILALLLHTHHAPSSYCDFAGRGRADQARRVGVHALRDQRKVH